MWHIRGRSGVQAVLVGLLVGGAGAKSWAIGPAYETDFQISQYPLIVVAKWDKAPVTNHREVEGNVCRNSEAFSELNVLRVLKGDVTPGPHKIVFGWGVGWQEDGTGLGTWTSTHLAGDVEDVTVPCLWFLDRERSWDSNDPIEYLHIPHYRAVQPLALEPYFVALTKADRDQEVPALLGSASALVVERALRYVCGEIWSWPYGPRDIDSFAYDRPKKRERLLAGAAPLVARVVADGPEELRPYAVALYAELVRKQALPRLRELLTDRNATVAGAAAAILARYKDAENLAELTRVARQVSDGRTAGAITDAVREWGELDAAPILLGLLENDAFTYQDGEGPGLVANRARAVLHTLTGCWFPFSVARAEEAWSHATSVTDDAERCRRLAELLPEPETPLVAELVGEPRIPPASSQPASQPTTASSPTRLVLVLESEAAQRNRLATVRLRNVTERTVTIARLPMSVVQACPSGGGDYALGPASDALTEADYVELAPGAALEFEIVLWGFVLRAEPDTRSLRLKYSHFAPSKPGNGWIGVLPVGAGESWKEERRREQVEEYWPNGNLRAVGATVNGERFGEWQFFNEAGDRIRVVDYGGGHGSGECNPEHENNKGAGKRSRRQGT